MIRSAMFICTLIMTKAYCIAHRVDLVKGDWTGIFGIILMVFLMWDIFDSLNKAE